MWLCLIGLIGFASAAPAQSDDLPRRGVIGLAVGPADASKPQDSERNPTIVKAVVAAGAGEAAGIKVGDVVRAVDGAPVATYQDFVSIIGRHLAGDRVTIRLVRDGQEIFKAVTLKPHPFETSADATLLYRSVTVEGARRRVIVTKPKASGRYPAVLVIGGLGCYSLDGELGRDTGYGPILSALAKQSWVTMRVEKTGEGDSEGPACASAQATVELEAEGYIAGLRALKSYDFVDPAKVFIFAHSLGPLIGALVVPREPVEGFVAAETIGRSWFEYGLENVRRQSALVGESLDEVDADVRAHEVCAHYFFVEHQSAAGIDKLNPQCREMIRSYAGMSDAYMHQIGDISLAKQWKQVDIPVLVIYGTADPATDSSESRYLAEIINSFHPGRASYVELSGMGHDFARYASSAEFLNRRRDPKPHPFDGELLDVLLKWLDQQAHA